MRRRVVGVDAWFSGVLCVAALGCETGERVVPPPVVTCETADFIHDDPEILTFSRSQLNSEMMFGASVISVDDATDMRMGDLKLSRPFVQRVEARINDWDGSVAFYRCNGACAADLAPPLARFGTKEACGEDQFALNAHSLPRGLSLEDLLNPYWSYYEDTLGARILNEEVVRAERDGDTSLIDVVTELSVWVDEYRAYDPSASSERKTVRVRSRWYLKPTADLTADFAPRDHSDKVGIFAALGPEAVFATRWPFEAGRDLHFFVKSVPTEYRPLVDEALSAWNDVLEAQLGRRPITHEFLEKAEEKFASVLLGDPRYAVIEWDEHNEASYAGVGAYTADEATGEMFAVAVNLQGRQFVELHKEWFETAKVAAELRARGDTFGAERARAKSLAQSNARTGKRLPPVGSEPRHSIPEDATPVRRDSIPRFDFDDPPLGIAFDEFIHGALLGLIEHELGHALGLEHNFMGSLAGDGGEIITSSVMEYLPRTHRNRQRIGPYDWDAARYAYAGELPEQTLPFCTHIDLPALGNLSGSAECSMDDLGPDPFDFLLQKRVARAMDLLLGRDLDMPAWTLRDVAPQLTEGVFGVSFYATSAEATSATWQAFFADASRPSQPEAIRSFVTDALHEALCGARVQANLARQRSQKGRELAELNWQSARGYVLSITEALELDVPDCEG